MAAIRQKDNRTELALRQVLHARGMRYRVHHPKVIGKPDIVFTRQRVAVFVDGDFWHGRVLREHGETGFYARFRTARREWWRKKLLRNIARDDYVTATLRQDGWTVIRFWESEFAADLSGAADEVMHAVREANDTGEEE